MSNGSPTNEKVKIMRIVKAGLLVLVLVLVGTRQAQAQETMDSLTYDDEERTFYVHVPESLDESPPLVIALNENMSTGRTMALVTTLDEAADEQGFVVVFPDTSGNVWGEDTTEDDLPDDVGFIGALIDYMAESYGIDPLEVYLTGFDDGGLMAYRLACEVPELFQSVAIVGAHMMGYHRDSCPEEVAAPVNMLIANGTRNALYTINSYEFTSIWQEENELYLGLQDTLAVWAERNDCDSQAMTETSNTLVFDSCADDVTVAYYQIHGGGKNWPRTGPYQLNQFGVDMTAMVTGFFFGAEDWGPSQAESFDETPRTYTVYLPTSYDPETPMPVVLFLHGRFGNGAGNAAYVGMNDIAETNNFIGVYPDGLRYPNPVSHDDWGWHYSRGITMSDVGDDAVPNDVAFLTALLADLAIDVNIDRQRIYTIGFSNGGYMVNRLACEVPQYFAGYASVAGSGYYGMPETCQTDTPVPVVIVHGTADDNVLWDGIVDQIGERQIYTSAPILQLANFWADHNECSDEVQRTELPQKGDSPDTSVTVVTVGDCAGESEVMLYAIINGGHNWPGVEREGTNTNMDINAGQVIWDFFARHALDEPPNLDAIDAPESEATEVPEPESTDESE